MRSYGEARQRRLGDGEPLGGGENLARFRDREELDQVAAPVEHSGFSESSEPISSPPSLHLGVR